MKNFLFLPALFACLSLPAQQLLQGKPVLQEKGVKNAYPRLSKDKSRMLYQSNRSGKWQLDILDLQSGRSTALFSDNYNNNFPDWSADNKMVAFVSDRDGNEEIYTIKTDGTGLKRITDNKARDIHPYFSPDGKYLLFNSDRGNGSLDIYRVTLATGETERLTDTPENETCARYSPDMKHMVFLKNDERTDDIFIRDMRSGAISNLTNTPAGTDGWPMYSGDGQWIWFSSMDTGLYCIYRIKTDGTQRQMLTKPSGKEEDARVCVSADGKMMLYNKDEGPTISIFTATIKG